MGDKGHGCTCRCNGLGQAARVASDRDRSVPEYDAPLPRHLAYYIAWNEPRLVSHHLVVASAESMDGKYGTEDGEERGRKLHADR